MTTEGGGEGDYLQCRPRKAGTPAAPGTISAAKNFLGIFRGVKIGSGFLLEVSLSMREKFT